MYCLNPLFPIYIDEMNNFRMGNLPQTGKYIENIDENLKKALFSLKNSALTKEEIIKKFGEFHISRLDSVSLLEELIRNEILVLYKDIETDDRQELFFSMFNLKNAKYYSEILKESRILIIGMGALGCSIANILCRSGINNFILLDSDVVEESNLRRQNLFYLEDIGKEKVISAKERMIRIKKNINVITVQADVLQLDSFSEFSPDIVICSADTPSRLVRKHVNAICVREGVPLIFAGFSEYLGLVGPLIVPGETACWECILEQLGELPLDINENRISPSFGALCEVVGGIVSIETIKFLTGFLPTKLKGAEFIYNLFLATVDIHSWKKNSQCACCKEKYSG